MNEDDNEIENNAEHFYGPFLENDVNERNDDDYPKGVKTRKRKSEQVSFEPQNLKVNFTEDGEDDIQDIVQVGNIKKKKVNKKKKKGRKSK